jgi:hypothetical protein
LSMNASPSSVSSCKDCAGIQPLAPCSRRQEPESITAAGISEVNSLARIPVGLGKLIETGKVSLRASGACMYPCVKPGDTLYLDPKGVAEISVGDIAVLRRDPVLVGHRVTRCGADARGRYIITKPDSARRGDDGPSYEEDVLGVISSILRKGRPVSTQPGEATSWARLQVMLLGASYRVQYSWARMLTKLLSLVQRSAPCGFVARHLFRLSVKDVRYSFQLPHRLGRSILHQSVSPEDLELALSKEATEKVDHWILTVHAGRDPKPCASVTFVFRQKECPLAGWWVGDLRTRFRYRGAGLEDALLTKAEGIFLTSGVAELKVSASDKATVDRFESLGFQKVDESGNHATFVRRIVGRAGVGSEMRTSCGRIAA